MFVYMIKNWNVWACRFAVQSVTSWGTGGVFACRIKTWHSLSPQLERCGDQRKVASYLWNMTLIMKISPQRKKIWKNITITQKYENNQKSLKLSNTRKKQKKYQK